MEIERLGSRRNGIEFVFDSALSPQLLDDNVQTPEAV